MFYLAGIIMFEMGSLYIHFRKKFSYFTLVVSIVFLVFFIFLIGERTFISFFFLSTSFLLNSASYEPQKILSVPISNYAPFSSYSSVFFHYSKVFYHLCYVFTESFFFFLIIIFNNEPFKQIDFPLKFISAF